MCWEADVGRTHLAFVAAGSRKASRGDGASPNEAATPLVRVNGGAKVKRCEEAKRDQFRWRNGGSFVGDVTPKCGMWHHEVWTRRKAL